MSVRRVDLVIPRQDKMINKQAGIAIATDKVKIKESGKQINKNGDSYIKQS